MKKLNAYLLIVGLLVMAGALGTATLDINSTYAFITDSSTWIILAGLTLMLMTYVASVKAQEAVEYWVARKEGRLPATEEEKTLVAEAETEGTTNWWKRLLQKLQDSKPIEEEQEIDMNHEYDGIRELDNNLPPWWLYGFYISIIWSVIYLMRYHVFETAPHQIEEYEMEMAAAAAAKEEYLKTAANLVDESNVTMLTEGPKLQAGSAIYKNSCAVCHAPDGGGGVGPNLADEYWLHGGSIGDVFATIKYGVPSKGMIPWKDQLSPTQIQEVASYVLSLKGTTPADPKKPEGELYEAPEMDVSSASEESASAEL